uniref:Neprilysin n=1 Tax=Macrostomum lignano TaxID=282301 RepID=A0A1I8GZR8_9PLAT
QQALSPSSTQTPVSLGPQTVAPMAADPESINMEMYAEPETSSVTARIWERVRQQLNPARHSIAENILAGIVVLLLVVVIALAATHGGGAGGGGGVETACQSEACLYRSGYLVSFLNRSASPCDNFYAFACGAAEQVMPINPAYRERTVSGELIRQNADKLEAALRSPIVRNSADSYERNSTWTRELLSAVKTYGASAFFEYRVEPNPLDGGRYTISIYNGGIGMLPAMYLFDFRESYKEYMRATAKLLVADAEPGTVDNPNGVTARIENFVLDVMEIETALANFSRNAVGPDPDKPPLAPGNQISLTEMDSSYQPIRWSALFSGTLESGVQGSTRVAVQTADYLTRAMTYVGETIRRLSNYLNWQVIRNYSGDLSSAYVHAKREFESSLSSSSYIYQSRLDYCLDRTKTFMLLGLNSLFVADHLVDSSKQAVDSLYKTLQSEFVSGIEKLDWIESTERAKMRMKIQAVVDKIGYSPTEIRDEFLDEYYKDNFKRLKQGSLLGTVPQATAWSGATFDVALSMTSTAQLTVPAGILQWPFFSPQLPGYINFATIGQRMAAELIKAVDATGQLTDQQGNSNPMWSERTRQSYLAKAQCVNFTYWDLTAGPYWVGNRSYYVDISPIISRTLRTAVAETDALRLVSKAYAGFEGGGSELPLPLGHLNKMQSLFTAWAQTFCFTRDPLYSYIRGALGRLMPEDIHVNGVLSLIPEFQSAFSCPADSAMVKLGGCGPIFYT